MFKAVDHPYLVPYDRSFRIAKAPTAPPDDAGKAKDHRKSLDKLRVELDDLQRMLYATDKHAVHALDVANGEPVWSFHSGGRIDSPPTVAQGRVVFGSADGYVYCLRAEDGQLAWRFRAAPQERRIMAFGQVESAWPVHGSVLVVDGQLYFVAGRTSYLDGGMTLYPGFATGG